MDAYLVAALVPLYIVTGWVAVTWIKAAHSNVERRTQEARLAELAERIEVLERVITDRRAQLLSAIERLRD